MQWTGKKEFVIKFHGRKKRKVANIEEAKISPFGKYTWLCLGYTRIKSIVINHLNCIQDQLPISITDAIFPGVVRWYFAAVHINNRPCLHKINNRFLAIRLYGRFRWLFAFSIFHLKLEIFTDWSLSFAAFYRCCSNWFHRRSALVRFCC